MVLICLHGIVHRRTSPTTSILKVYLSISVSVNGYNE
jgi:hypothetical protein